MYIYIYLFLFVCLFVCLSIYTFYVLIFNNVLKTFVLMTILISETKYSSVVHPGSLDTNTTGLRWVP